MLLRQQDNKQTNQYKNYSFDRIIDDFIKQAEYTVKHSTYNHYVNMIEAHIRPYFENRSCEFMTSSDIEKFASEKLRNGRMDGKGGLSPKSVKDLLSVLRRILKYGVEKEILNFSILNFSAPKTRQNSIQILEKDEACILKRKILESNESYKFGIYLCLYTGLRLGEVCALKWQDIDLESKTLTVNKTMIRLKDNETGKTEVCIEKPKTQSSNRVIPLPDVLIKELGLRQVPDKQAYILTGNKNYIEPRTYYEKYKRCLKECGIKPHSFHCLRHTFATNCVQQGFDPKTLSEILGHSDVKVTFDRYVHPSMEMKRKYMNLLR